MEVFILVSGGVDSSVAFALLAKALGKERCYGLLVDHGLLRHKEAEEVVAAMTAIGFDNLHLESASDLFLSRLQGVFDPGMFNSPLFFLKENTLLKTYDFRGKKKDYRTVIFRC